MIFNVEIKPEHTTRIQEAFKVIFELETVTKANIENILKKHIIQLVRQHELTQDEATAKQNYTEIE